MNTGSFSLIVFICLIVVAALFLFTAHILLSNREERPEELSPPADDKIQDDDMKSHYLLISVMFVIFVAQAALIFPWALIFGNMVVLKMGWQMFVSLGLFLIMIFFSFLYVWSRGMFGPGKGR